MINWESEPEAVAYKPDCENWYGCWWKFEDGDCYVKYAKPKHWQIPGWYRVNFAEDFVKSIVGITFKNIEAYVTTTSITTKSSVVAVYKTTDGKVFATLTDAEEHQSKVDIWNKIADKFGCYGEVKLSYLSDFLDMIKYYEENK